MSDFKFQDDYPVDEMSFESFKQYQDFTATTDKAGTTINTLLGMTGEVGELLEKMNRGIFPDEIPTVHKVLDAAVLAGVDCEALKKATRVDQLEAVDLLRFSEDEKVDLANEVADVVWYLARFCDRLGQDFSQVMQRNVAKLSSRKDRGVLHSKGDKR